ncbi:hypothetical protein MMC13_005786 [Lambiella insularis]|nr:hypothetical protein [Lambiella insularis]
MDPASAGIAFVGFAASIATLAAVVVDSCQTLHDVCKSFREAPADIRRLYTKVLRLERMIQETKKIGEEFHGDPPPVDLQTFWNEIVIDVEKDFRILQEKITKLRASLENKSWSTKHFSARFRKFFADEEIKKLERIISYHLDTFQYMLSMLTNARAKVTVIEVRNQSKHIDFLVSSATHLQSSHHRQLGGIKQTCDSPMWDISRKVAEALEGIDMRGYNPQEQVALRFLRNAPTTQEFLRIEKSFPKEAPIHGMQKSLKPQKATTKHAEPPLELNLHSPSLSERSCQTPDNAQNSWNSSKSTYTATKYRGERVFWKLSVFQFPVGILSIERTQRSLEHSSKASSTRNAEGWFYSINFSLFPPSWIANIVIKLYLTLNVPQLSAPSIGWSLKQVCYNDNPLLLEYLHNEDLAGLQGLFSEGHARPNDILAPWGNTILHEAVITQVSGRSHSLKLCQFLLEQGADPNTRNIKGSMMAQNTLESQLNSIASLLICANSDMTLCDYQGSSPCSLIFKSQHGLEYLETFVYKHIDLFTLQQMASVDAWILAAMARSLPIFQKCLEVQLQEYRTPKQLSSCQLPREENVIQFDPQHQIEEVKKAIAEVRTSFLSALCTKGTVSMIMPFLHCGIDLDELSTTSSSTYVRSAAKQGNTEVVLALLEAGASMNVGTASIENEGIGPVDEFLERWFSLLQGRPEYFGCAELEFWVLPKLLQNPTFRGPNVLFLSLKTDQPDFIFRYLLEAGCGRRDNTPPASWKTKVLGSEIIEAVELDRPIISVLLEYGLGLECEDRLGFTALLHALDRGRGRVDYTRILVDAGADIVRRTASGYTPLQFAKANLRAQHPRFPKRSKNSRAWQLQPVSLEEDQAAYEMLKSAIQERRLKQAKWSILAINQGISRMVNFNETLVSESQFFVMKYPVTELLWAALGSVLTMSVFGFVLTWEMAWKIVRMRKHYSTHIIAFLLAGYTLWKIG